MTWTIPEVGTERHCPMRHGNHLWVETDWKTSEVWPSAEDWGDTVWCCEACYLYAIGPWSDMAIASIRLSTACGRVLDNLGGWLKRSWLWKWLHWLGKWIPF